MSVPLPHHPVCRCGACDLPGGKSSGFTHQARVNEVKFRMTMDFIEEQLDSSRGIRIWPDQAELLRAYARRA